MSCECDDCAETSDSAAAYGLAGYWGHCHGRRSLLHPSGGPQQRWLKAVTGLDCPACGGLRCVHALMNGDIGTALDQNLIAVVVLPMIVIWAAFALAARWRGDDAVGANSSADVDAQGNAALKANALRVLWVGLIVATIVFTVLRNVPGVPFLPSGVG